MAEFRFKTEVAFTLGNPHIKKIAGEMFAQGDMKFALESKDWTVGGLY